MVTVIILLLVIRIEDRFIFAGQMRFIVNNFFEREYKIVSWFCGKEYCAPLQMSVGWLILST